jgi:hypothetical protein
MTKGEFMSLPINRATVKKLSQPSVFFQNPAFYSEFIASINEYLALPISVKAFHKTSMEAIYNQLKAVKAAGHRKELVIEFND